MTDNLTKAMAYVRNKEEALNQKDIEYLSNLASTAEDETEAMMIGDLMDDLGEPTCPKTDND